MKPNPHSVAIQHTTDYIMATPDNSAFISEKTKRDINDC